MNIWILRFVFVFLALPTLKIQAEELTTPETYFQKANLYTVKVRSRVEYPFVNDERGSFSGAGFLVDKKRGWIATNAHVTSTNPSVVEVAFKDQVFEQVTVLYIDRLLDLAILEIPLPAIPKFAENADIECQSEPIIGSAVGAYGHPFSLDFSGTRGIVSGNRYRWGRYWVQTDAAINNGNSGGPLINLHTGKIIGINSATYSKRMSEGLGFAVHMLRVCRVLEVLKRNGDPSPPFIPVSFTNDDRQPSNLIIAETYKKQTVLWPLKPDDQIIALAESPNQQLKHQSDLIHVLRGKRGKVEVIVKRNGANEQFSIAVAPRPKLLDRIGVHVSGIIFSHESLKDDEIINPRNLLFIQNIATASIGALAGIQPYGYLHSTDGHTFSDPIQLCNFLKNLEPNQLFTIVTRHLNWDYRSRTRYNSYKIPVNDVKLVGPGTPKTCG